ncbi:MAG: tyrosine-type recombinase/integrase, partial [Solirubrobacterales bacterium]
MNAPVGPWSDLINLHERDLVAAGAAPRTITAYRRDLTQFSFRSAEQLPDPVVVGHRDVRRYAAFLSASSCAPATVARKLAAIRSFYGFLLRTGRVTQNPADLVSAPKAAARLPRVLTSAQMAEILDTAPSTTPLEVRDQAMIELAYSCGLRSEEVILLSIDSLDFESEQLSVVGKGSRHRRLPVGEPAQRAVED